MKKIVLTTICLTLGLNANPINAKQLFNIEKIKPKIEEFQDTKEFYGITKLNESKTLDIVSRFDGYITHLNANKNYTNIKKGEELYTIYSSEIASIKNELEVAKEISDNLYKKNSLKLANFDLANANFKAKDIVVNSPISGIIIAKNINNKSYVEKGKTLFTISSLEDIWFIASIYQDDLKYIKKGQKAKIKLDGIDKSIETKVDFIYPIFNENRTIDIRFEIENRDLSTLPSMFGKVKIEYDKKEILSLPKTAVIKKDEGYFVFLPKENGEFTPKKIEAKRVSGEKYEILSGLSKDDMVINNSLFLYDADAMTNRLYDEEDEEW